MSAFAGRLLGSRWINVLLLAGSFALGQGVLFVAQTWMVAANQLQLLSLFGAHFAFSILGNLIVDAGALTTLSRQTAANLHSKDGTSEISRHYWSTSYVRIGLGIALALIAIAYAFLAGDGFSRNYAIGAVPALLLWAFNAAGILDGLGRSGISGVTGIFSYFISGIALLLCIQLPLPIAGLVLGISFSIGIALAVVAQITSLSFFRRSIKYRRPQAAELVYSAQEAISMLVYTVPPQLLYRIQILVCIFLFPAATTAIFIYVKQIINALSQMINFFRRVEFPSLVEELANSSDRFLFKTFFAFRYGFGAAVVAFVLILVVCVTGRWYLPPSFGAVIDILPAFAPLVLTSTVTNSLALSLVARSLSNDAARAVSIGIVVGILAIYPIANVFGPSGFAIAEMLFHVTTTCLLIRIFHLGRLSESKKQTQ